MRVPNFPRFPYSFPNNVTAAMWDLIGRWADGTNTAINDNEIRIERRRVLIDDNASIAISGRIKVGDTGAAVTPETGDIRFNATTNKFQGYDGTTWQDFH